MEQEIFQERYLDKGIIPLYPKQDYFHGYNIEDTDDVLKLCRAGSRRGKILALLILGW
jgi:hypothetical protein